jgi:hypothetical protein
MLTIREYDDHHFSLAIWFVMQIIDSRTYAFLDSQTLRERSARDTLFKMGADKFLLHMACDGNQNDRLIWIDSRSALLWINQEENDYGMHWE